MSAKKMTRYEVPIKKEVATETLGLILAALLFVYSLAVIPADLFVYNVHAFTAAVVGSSSSVAPNPDNTAAQQLKDKEEKLNQRAADLNALQQQITARDSESIAVAWASLYGSLILFALIGLNFYMDMKRRRDPRAAPGKFSIDLSKT